MTSETVAEDRPKREASSLRLTEAAPVAGPPGVRSFRDRLMGCMLAKSGTRPEERQVVQGMKNSFWQWRSGRKSHGL